MRRRFINGFPLFIFAVLIAGFLDGCAAGTTPSNPGNKAAGRASDPPDSMGQENVIVKVVKGLPLSSDVFVVRVVRANPPMYVNTEFTEFTVTDLAAIARDQSGNRMHAIGLQISDPNFSAVDLAKFIEAIAGNRDNRRSPVNLWLCYNKTMD